jgi:hypothetical protein
MSDVRPWIFALTVASRWRKLPSGAIIPHCKAMTSSLLRAIGLSGLIIGSLVTVRAQELPLIAKARALIAPDAVLDAVRTLHYVGSLTATSSAQPGKLEQEAIEIFLEKPARQRIVVTSADAMEINALDGYDAWRRTIDTKNPNKWQQNQMSSEQIKQLRADVWENLSFFRGIERVGGWTEDQGLVVTEGVPCRKIAFYHGSSTTPYFRFLDASTGKLILTGTPENNIRAEGEIVSAGIKFPQVIIITQSAGGQTFTRKVKFEKITVNESFPAALFAMPLPTVK